MKNIQRFLSASLIAIGFAAASAATGAPIVFVAPNDAGRVFTTNSNDSWSGGRGIGFNVSSSQVINSVGVYQNLSNKALSYGLYEISSPTGGFSKTATLRSGSATVNTSGLEFIDFSFADLTLLTVKNYLLEFSFSGNSAQNFFYNNGNVAWSQGAYTKLEGTASSSFSNSVVGEFRLNNTNQVPEPGTVFLIGVAVLGLAAGRRARKA